ncbi:MAG TPA: hypothetical protein VHG08_07320 [Longimicrobium sp.]|nr:hypothetical protein [Longimicrobium sp.]
MRVPRLRHPVVLCAVAAACAGLHAGKALAQASPQPEPAAPRAYCPEGRPARECRVFLVVEGRLYRQLAGSRYAYRHGPFGPRANEVERHLELSGYVAYELGVMVNTAPDRAFGASLLLGADETGERLGMKGRYRGWLSPTAAWDVGAGVLGTKRRVTGEFGHEYVTAAGLTGDVSIGLTEWVGIGVQGDLLFSQGGRDPATGLYAGAKLGGRPTGALTGFIVSFATVMIIIFVGSGADVG